MVMAVCIVTAIDLLTKKKKKIMVSRTPGSAYL